MPDHYTNISTKLENVFVSWDTRLATWYLHSADDVHAQDVRGYPDDVAIDNFNTTINNLNLRRGF